MAPPFRYLRPRQLSEAFDILGRFGPEARLLAGGTDLVVGLRKGRIAARILVDLKRITDLAPGISTRDGRVTIFAPTPLTDVIADGRIQEQFPALTQAARTVGSVQIRNRATLTGNICNASPAADTEPALLAYGATVVLISSRGSRRVPIADFVLGPRSTSLRPDEIAAAVELSVPAARTGAQFARLTRRRGVDLATVSVCCTVGEQVTRLAYGAVAPKPFVLTDDTGVLADQDASPEARSRLLGEFAAQAAPISDLRGSRAYREAMLLTVSQRALQAAIAQRDRKWLA